jgi:tRNA(Ile2) C34 agmatinyltransferase TiaS
MQIENLKILRCPNCSSQFGESDLYFRCPRCKFVISKKRVRFECHRIIQKEVNDFYRKHFQKFKTTEFI